MDDLENQVKEFRFIPEISAGGVVYKRDEGEFCLE